MCIRDSLGGLHRNTFIKSPILLDSELRFKNQNNIRIAGQITGVEGYLESAAIGMLVGIFAANEVNNKTTNAPPKETALGALLSHITGDAEVETFQPMNVNFGLFPELETKVRRENKKSELSKRALEKLDDWKETLL